MTSENDQLPGGGFFGWLGRQVGHVAKAVNTDVTAPPPEQPLFEEKHVEESPHPKDPTIILRRTTIDQAVRRPDAGSLP